MPSGLAGYTYKPRSIAFQGSRSLGRWAVKSTIITVRGGAPHFADEIEAAWAVVGTVMEAVPDRGLDAGIAFMTVHVGMAGVRLLIDWWEQADMLRHRHFRSSIDDPARFADVGAEQFGPCLWELAVQAHEREAWLRHVLTNPISANLAAYLADGLTATL